MRAQDGAQLPAIELLLPHQRLAQLIEEAAVRAQPCKRRAIGVPEQAVNLAQLNRCRGAGPVQPPILPQPGLADEQRRKLELVARVAKRVWG